MAPGAAGCTASPPTDAAGCATRAAAITAATTRLTNATQSLERWSAAAQVARETAGTGASTTPPTVPNPQQQQNNQPSDTALGQVADTVETIVTQAFATDETQLLCLQILSTDSQLRGVDTVGSDGRTVRGMCLDYLAARVQSDTRMLANWRVPAARMAELEAQIAIVEAYLSADSSSTPAARWNARVPEVQRLYPAANLIVPANATIEDIKRKMRENVGALREFVRIISGGS